MAIYTTTVLDVLKATSAFLAAAVGNKVVFATPSATTETVTLKEGSTTVLVYTLTYTDSTKATLDNVERTG